MSLSSGAVCTGSSCYIGSVHIKPCLWPKYLSNHNCVFVFVSVFVFVFVYVSVFVFVFEFAFVFKFIFVLVVVSVFSFNNVFVYAITHLA